MASTILLKRTPSRFCVPAQQQLSKHSTRALTRSQNFSLARSRHLFSTSARSFNDETEKTKPSERHESLANAKPIPWHYENADKAPIQKKREPSVKDKGKLLSTPSRLLKLLLPLKRPSNNQESPKSAEPLALLVHPRQPLSYLERLIQSELPPVTPPGGAPRPPEVAFKAVDVGDTLLSKRSHDGTAGEAELSLRGGEGEGGVETGGGLGRHSQEPKSGEGGLVRWSTSTEVGDFVRDAARGKEFVIEIEGNDDVPVGVPSFHQRTHYLRQRLLAITKSIEEYSKLKSECDDLAHRGAQRVAMGGFAGLLTWWGGVYWLTFETRLGWDVMEPVTYLVGLSTVMCSYLWFLYHNREVSYRSLLHMTVTKRQMKLYDQRGFNLERWEELVDEGRTLRREIKNIAEQYDVDWDERHDEAGGEKVLRVLKEGEEKNKRNAVKSDDEKDREEEEAGELEKATK